MKKQLVIILISGFSLWTACTDVRQTNIERYQTVYTYTRDIGDLVSAVNSMHHLLQLQPDSLHYYDSLASLYYKAELFAAAYNTTQTALDNGHNSLQLLQVRGYAATKVNRHEDAVVSFQDLLEMDKENSLEYTYQLGLAFYWMENFESAVNYMTQVANEKESRYNDVILYAEGKPIKVTYYLAALNTIGFCFMQTQQLDKAEEVFLTALKENPDFALAANNYKLLQQLKDRE